MDFERLILPLADSGVYLAGALGESVPLISNDEICFNGLRLCGHSSNEAIVIPYPTDDACGIGPNTNAIQDDTDGLTTRIKHRCCNGRCSYETFRLQRSLQADRAEEPDANGLWIEYVKTGFRPYDVAVTATLLITKRNLKNEFVVYSDGADRQWSDAKRICQKALGYGEWFGIVEEPIEERCLEETDVRKVLQRTLVEMGQPDTDI